MGLPQSLIATVLFCTPMLVPQMLAATEADVPAKITQLSEEPISTADLKREGFATPQTTARTFMWSLRERDADSLRTCFTTPSKMEPVDFNDESLKEASERANGFQAMAIRTIDDSTVDLKFRVVGWGDKPFSHRLKRVGDAWKLDSDSNTTEPNW